MRKRIALFLLLGLLLQMFALSVSAEWSSPEEHKKQLIREMVYLFSITHTYSGHVNSLMDELKNTDRSGSVTEAGLMEAWLTENGVDPERIITETQSANTVENTVYSMQILRENYPEVTELAIVSSDYHVIWGAVFFQAISILSSEDPKKPDIKVVSNAAFETSYGNGVSPWDIQRWGLLGIAGYI